MNPKKIAISQPWTSRTMNQNVKDEAWIRKSINGIFQQFNMIPSEIYIHNYPKKISINFLIFVPKRTSQRGVSTVLTKIISLIKSILTLKYSKNIHVNFKVIPSIFHDAHIMGKWIKLQKNPMRFKYTMKKLLSKAKTK